MNVIDNPPKGEQPGGGETAVAEFTTRRLE